MQGRIETWKTVPQFGASSLMTPLDIIICKCTNHCRPFRSCSRFGETDSCKRTRSSKIFKVMTAVSGEWRSEKATSQVFSRPSPNSRRPPGAAIRRNSTRRWILVSRFDSIRFFVLFLPKYSGSQDQTRYFSENKNAVGILYIPQAFGTVWSAKRTEI
jgi:hypothetical protein